MIAPILEGDSRTQCFQEPCREVLNGMRRRCISGSFTAKFSASSLVNIDFDVARCSCQVHAEIRMSSTQLIMSGSFVPRACLTILVKADRSAIKPNPALLNSHKRPSESRKAVSHLSFSG